ncbi:MAG TPA: NAD(P)-binding protein [Micromonosporaceae bacterium]|nr:NAD(P)-binding protein [Micromonosporaceae bacterium]
MQRITVVGGAFAGLVAAITCAEAGAQVRLFEAHRTLGGRARATAPPYVAHDGPHVLYADGPWWRWLSDRDLIGRHAGVPLRAAAGFRFRWDGRLRRTPPAVLLRVLAHRRRRAPIDVDFHTWVSTSYGERAATAAANLMGVATFDAQPGRLAAAFVWERLLRVFAPSPPARYVIGGWNGLIDRLASHARMLGSRSTPTPGSPHCRSHRSSWPRRWMRRPAF